MLGYTPTWHFASFNTKRLQVGLDIELCILHNMAFIFLPNGILQVDEHVFPCSDFLPVFFISFQSARTVSCGAIWTGPVWAKTDPRREEAPSPFSEPRWSNSSKKVDHCDRTTG